MGSNMATHVGSEYIMGFNMATHVGSDCIMGFNMATHVRSLWDSTVTPECNNVLQNFKLCLSI